MKNYVIVTESGADVAPSVINYDNIKVLPMHVELNDMDYLDDGTLTIEELCRYYDTTGKVPKTAAVNPDEYRQAFEKIIDENPDAIIIHIGYAAELSCTYQNAVIASDGELPVYHIDSANVSGGIAFIVMLAAKLIQQSPEIEPDELVARIKEYAVRTHFSFVPGNLDYLRAGGRVSNGQYLGASILRLKPLIEIVDGKMLSTKKLRGGHNTVVLKMIKDFFGQFNIDRTQIYMLHAHKLEPELEQQVAQLLGTYEVQNFDWMPCGSVITSHAGPGGIGIAGIEKEN